MGSHARENPEPERVTEHLTVRASRASDRDELRAADESDLATICRIERASFADPWSESDFRSMLRFAAGIFLVSAPFSTGSVKGYVIALAVLDEAEIINLGVDAGSRRMGIGGRLLDEALARVEAKGVVTTFLEVRESNVAARALYGSRGFSEISRRRGYYRTPVEDALVLRRGRKR